MRSTKSAMGAAATRAFLATASPPAGLGRVVRLIAAVGAAVSPVSADGGATDESMDAGSTDVSAVVRSLVGIRRGSLAVGVSGCSSRRVAAGDGVDITGPVSADGGSCCEAEDEEEVPASRSSVHGACAIDATGDEATASRGSVLVFSVRGCLAMGSAAVSSSRGRAADVCAPESADGGVAALIGEDSFSDVGSGSLGILWAGSSSWSGDRVSDNVGRSVKPESTDVGPVAAHAVVDEEEAAPGPAGGGQTHCPSGPITSGSWECRSLLEAGSWQAHSMGSVQLRMLGIRS